MQSAKRAAAYYAVKAHVRSGDGVGVGTGSTARYVVECLAELYAAGTLVNIQCVPTSFEVRASVHVLHYTHTL
jgi:ribose 5-phosphate isomerase A